MPGNEVCPGMKWGCSVPLLQSHHKIEDVGSSNQVWMGVAFTLPHALGPGSCCVWHTFGSSAASSAEGRAASAVLCLGKLGWVLVLHLPHPLSDELPGKKTEKE